jgi:Fur family transcriptional regulator, peroxide stress response regulator
MNTPQRNSILNYLKNSAIHPTAKDIYHELSGKEKISMATVYNALALMKRKGIVREFAISNSDRKRYDTDLTPHAHLICNNCGKITDGHFPLHLEIPDEHKQGFVAKDIEINFYGLCPRCKKKNDPTSA